MNNRIKKAHDFVKEKHKNQKRKFTGKAYLTHLENTANLLWSVNEDAETDMFVAALLHDIVEDTFTTLKEVGQNFGQKVMNLVEELTTDENEKNIKGKTVYLTQKINNMSENAFTIKLCDRLDNVMGLNNKSISSQFIARYIEETKHIIINLDRDITAIQKHLLERIKSTILYLELS